MKQMAIIFLFLAFLFPAAAEDLDTILRSALESSREITLLKKQYEKAVLEYVNSTELSPVSFFASTGKNGIGVEWDWTGAGDSFTWFLEPSLSFYAGENIGTKVSLNLFYRSSNRNPNYPQTDLAVSQSLNRILGLYNKETWNESLAFYNAEKIRLNLLAASYDIQIQVLDDLAALFSAKKDFLDSSASFISAEQAYTEMISLGLYEPGSVSYKFIDYEYQRIKGNIEGSSQKYERLRKIFQARYGYEITELPATVPDSSQTVLELKENGQLVDDYLQELKIKSGRQKVEQTEFEYPEFSLLFNYKNYQDNATDVLSNISGGVSFAWNGFTMSALSGVRLEQERFFISFALAYTLPNYIQEAYQLNSAKKDLEISEIEQRISRDDASLRIMELENSYYSQIQTTKNTNLLLLAKQAEEEKSLKEYQAGLISVQDYNKTVFQRQSLELQKTSADIGLLKIIFQANRLYTGETDGR